VSDEDPIAPLVEVRSVPGESLLFSHRYVPAAGADKLAAIALIVSSALRPPMGDVYSFLSHRPQGGDTDRDALVRWPFEEPLLSGAKRAWLLAADLAVSALCTLSIIRRMRRQGSGAAAVIVAATITAIMGVLAYVYLRVLLPKHHVSRTPEGTPSEAHGLLIQSAA
jgi:hypothetical protein